MTDKLEPFSTKLPRSTKELIEKYAESSMIPKARFINAAIVQYIKEKIENKK